MRLVSILVLANGAVAGCSAGEPALDRGSAPVIGGVALDAGEYDSTVALGLFGYYFCTGTLIAPDVVLTAGHCLELDGQVPGIALGNDTNQLEPDALLPGLAAFQHPGFDVDEIPDGLGRFDDIGLVVLEQPVAGVTPTPIATAAEAAELLVPGAMIELAGYGVSDDEASEAGIKLKGRGTLREVGEWELLLSNPGEQQNCFGDSGGPGFVQLEDGGRRLVGVVSRGPDAESQACDIGGIDTRADAYLGWIDEVLAGRDGGAGGLSDAAPVAAPDAGDVAEGDDDGDDDDAAGCCAVAGRRARTSAGVWLAAGLAAAALALARRRRRSPVLPRGSAGSDATHGA